MGARRQAITQLGKPCAAFDFPIATHRRHGTLEDYSTPNAFPPTVEPLNLPHPMRITITDLALGGDGVGRLPDGCAVFVPFTIPGEEVEVEIVSAHKRFARARLVEVVKPSPDRVAPRCPLFDRCGGCQYQHMTYAAQLAAKTRQLRETLARLGGFRENLPEIATVRSPHEFGYRNKLRLEKVSGTSCKSCFGFYSTDNENILPVEACPIAMESLNQLLAAANRQDGGVAASVFVRESPCPSVKVRADNRSPATSLENRKSSIENTLTLRQPAVGEAVAFRGRPGADAPPLVERALGRDVLVAQGGFWQVNPGVASELVRLVAEWAAEAPAEHLVDAYGGVGVFGLATGCSCGRQTIIEMDAEAVRLARANFAAWGLPDAEFIAQPTERALPRLLAAAGNANAVTTGLAPVERMMTGKDSPCSRTHTPSHVSTGASPVVDATVPSTQNSTFGIRHSKFSPPDVILDPPRGGCDAALLDALLKHPPRRLLYVSCNPATLARDLRTLTQDSGPFRLDRLTLLDMFPQTAHFETMAVLGRR